MKMDEQIREIKCEKCGLTPAEGKAKGTIILNCEGLWLCGGCFLEFKQKQINENRRILLTE